VIWLWKLYIIWLAEFMGPTITFQPHFTVIFVRCTRKVGKHTGLVGFGHTLDLLVCRQTDGWTVGGTKQSYGYLCV